MKKIFLFAAFCIAFVACKKDTVKETEPDPTPTNNCPPASCVTPDTIYPMTGTGPFLIFKFKFDSTQARLDAFGNPAVISSTNAGFSPRFNKMSAHYIELSQNSTVAVGSGKVLYRAPETDCAGSNAITFCQSITAKEGDTFFAIPISAITPGTYQWLRISLAYQNYDIPYLNPASTSTITQWGTVASFIGFKTYVNQYKVKTMMATPTASTGGPGNHLQGYWGFETLGLLFDGQAAGTTVVNPISTTSPIPPGSCLVTGELYSTLTSATSPLVITGLETANITVTVSLSTNKSFEWSDNTGVWPGYYEPGSGEHPVDMGIRGMIPKY